MYIVLHLGAEDTQNNHNYIPHLYTYIYLRNEEVVRENYLDDWWSYPQE
jgi:hypothetical protein